MVQEEKGRSYGFDNMRAFLIACVVVGHLLEICPNFPGKDLMYRVIYSFHIPAFLFLTGYFGKFQPRQIFRGLILPYFLLQTLYLLFAQHVLGVRVAMQYTTPYWLLWYLPVCLYCKLLIPMLDTQNKKQQLIVLLLAVALALLAGYDCTVSYYLSLSRFLVFLPWFVLGYYCRKHQERLLAYLARYRWLLAAIFGAVILFSAAFLANSHFLKDVLYGSYPYARLGYDAALRGMLMLPALAWIGLLLCLFTGPLNRKLFGISALGHNTLPVFLLHGFAVRLIAYKLPWLMSSPWAILWIGGGILLLLGNVFVGELFQLLFGGKRK
jgi:fucose 4-O-acetylase-like acetyltransferase